MAPGMFRKGGQTSNLDIWSLFVTMIRILDIEGFRKGYHQFQSITDVEEAVLLAARKSSLARIQEMAIVNPEERASAAQMLVKHFDGAGLSTPPNHIPALSRPSMINVARAAPPSSVKHRKKPPLTATAGLAALPFIKQTPQSKLTDLQTDKNQGQPVAGSRRSTRNHN